MSHRHLAYGYPLLALAAIGLPVLLHRLNWPIIANTYGKAYEPFELFAFCASGALILVTGLEIRRRRPWPLTRLAPVLLFALTGFFFLSLMAEYSFKSWDYQCYENAARALLEGGNPYPGTHYIYPPLLAQTMAAVARLLQKASPQRDVWDWVFYLYQCTQFMLVLAAYLLGYHLAREWGLKDWLAAGLITALFLFNNPLLRTLRHNQVNLWILNALLLSLLCLNKRPWLAGLAVALAAHIKLYPAVMWLPWAGMKKYRPLFWSALGALGLLLVEISGRGRFDVWRKIVASLASFPASTAFRNTSLRSILYASLKLVGRVGNVDVTLWYPVADRVVFLLTLVVILWFIVRFVRREQAYWALQGLARAERQWPELARTHGHLLDAIAMILIISPMVWEHHYVLAIPIILWAIILQGRHRPWRVGIGAFLILVVPTFDVFPLSYHRLVGLLLLLRCTPPSLAQQPCAESQAAAH